MAGSAAGSATRLAAIAVFFALVIDGMDFQMLALSLPSISKELHLSPLNTGALSTYTLVGMGSGGALAGWLTVSVVSVSSGGRCCSFRCLLV
jgi:AAHS family cis,cis-muconate transporter-like MFS transporter